MTKQNSSKHIPLYVQLANIIRKRIKQHHYQEGKSIPSELSLQKEFSVSRTTVRNALKVLTSENILIKLPGKGTFVTDQKNEIKTQKHHFLSFTESVKKTGKKLSSRLIKAHTVVGNTEQRQFFKLTPQEQLIEIKRLRYLDGIAFCVEWIWLPTKFADITQNNLDNSLYDLLRKKYQIIPTNGKKTFKISFADQEESFLLNVDQGSPLMQINDFVFDNHEESLYISKQVLRSDKFTYAINH